MRRCVHQIGSLIHLAGQRAAAHLAAHSVIEKCHLNPIKLYILGGIPVRAKAEPESRSLSTSELELVSFTQYAIEQLPIERLKAVGRRLRQAHVLFWPALPIE